MTAWINHDGMGCPLAAGTLIDVRHFNGEVTVGVRVGGFCVNDDGSLKPGSGRWSGWDHHDGGPMAPKFRSYRLNERHARNAALFASWLATDQMEAAHADV